MKTTEKDPLAGVRLRVGTVMVSTDVNGPGRRLVIWLQGCEFHCQGCFNPEFHDPAGGRTMSGREILAMADDDGRIEGLTFSGGEPFLQAGALARLAAAARRQGYSIVCYTGYTLVGIYSGKPEKGRQLLSQVDLLIDGLFDRKQQAALAWRGSANQRLHFLSSRYQNLRDLANGDRKRRVEVVLGDGSLAMTGIFPEEFWRRLQRKLESRV